VGRAKRHELLDIVAITICAVICGADNWVDIELFGNSKRKWLGRFLSLPNGIPSHDTFGRVFGMVDPDEFEQCFIEWVRDVHQLSSGQVIAIDGKTARGSSTKGKGAIHLVSAWASANHLVLAQAKVDQKSNEITAIPELLEILELSGCIVTIDAMGCQTQIAEQIVDKQADYVLALKANQKHLYESISTRMSKTASSVLTQRGFRISNVTIMRVWAKITVVWRRGDAGAYQTAPTSTTLTLKESGRTWHR
jgi:predicted transposase YbfD/YdcC